MKGRGRRSTSIFLFMLAASGAAGCGGGNDLKGDADARIDPGLDLAVEAEGEGDPAADPPPDEGAADGTIPDGDALPGDPDAVEPLDATPDAVPDDGGGEEGEGGEGAGCAAEIAAIAAETGIVGSCTGVVRLAYSSREILGWQLVCGSYAHVTETSARAQAQADTGYGASGTMLNPASPEDEYVFHVSPGDFGGASAVNARSGKSVFGGSIIWMGTGAITWPAIWRPASSLGSGCPVLPRVIPARGYRIADSGEPLDAGLVTAALDVVRGTALPEGMMTSGYVFDAVVLLYARSVGAFDPASAEWIVLLNGGWLE